MAFRSDLTLDLSKFDPDSVDESTKEFNDQLMAIMKDGPFWYDVGAEKFRQMRWRGETSLPKPVVLENGKRMSIPSRESGRDIPCRYFEPDHVKPQGVYFHIHGGGWVLQSEEYQDLMLNQIAQETGLTVVSLGYRLAPENPFPAGPEDCYDAGDWLVDNAKKHFGAELLFVGGESAGGHLSCCTIFHLLRSRPHFAFKGAVLNCGCYDLSLLPQVYTYQKPEVLVIDGHILGTYLDVFLPGKSFKDRKHPSISPLYEDMSKLKLPSVFLTVGTEDCLLDDSILLAAKWQLAGGEAILKVYPGAPHGFTLYPVGQVKCARQGMGDVIEYLKHQI